jgi:hypothetical protein
MIEQPLRNAQSNSFYFCWGWDVKLPAYQNGESAPSCCNDIFCLKWRGMSKKVAVRLPGNGGNIRVPSSVQVQIAQ